MFGTLCIPVCVYIDDGRERWGGEIFPFDVVVIYC